MSYIQCVATFSQVILTSDGRVCFHNGEIVREDYKKIKRINRNLAVAFAGLTIPCEIIIDNTINKFDEDVIDKINVDEFYNKLFLESKNYNKLYFEENQKNLKTQFIIGGLRNNDNLGILTLSVNNEFKSENYFSNTSDNISFASGTSNQLGDSLLGDNLIKLDSTGNSVSLLEIKKVMNDTSRYMATIDNSVNSKIFREIIYKLI